MNNIGDGKAQAVTQVITLQHVHNSLRSAKEHAREVLSNTEALLGKFQYPFSGAPSGSDSQDESMQKEQFNLQELLMEEAHDIDRLLGNIESILDNLHNRVDG